MLHFDQFFENHQTAKSTKESCWKQPLWLQRLHRASWGHGHCLRKKRGFQAHPESGVAFNNHHLIISACSVLQVLWRPIQILQKELWPSLFNQFNPFSKFLYWDIFNDKKSTQPLKFITTFVYLIQFKTKFVWKKSFFIIVFDISCAVSSALLWLSTPCQPHCCLAQGASHYLQQTWHQLTVLLQNWRVLWTLLPAGCLYWQSDHQYLINPPWCTYGL